MALYFIDSQNGNDGFSGLSPQEALKTLEAASKLSLKPGDRILLKRGCIFNGTLTVDDSGEKYNNIIISSYGKELKRPIIIAGDKAENAVLVTGEYVSVDGLEVTNPTGNGGITVRSRIHGAVHGVTVCNCYIHDIHTANGVLSKAQRSVGGAGYGTRYTGICFETNREAPTWFEEARIENNRIENINRNGIWFGGKWYNRFKNSFPWCENKPTGMDEPWYPSKNIYIGHNYLDHTYGDAVIAIGCVNLLMEYNKVFYANFHSVAGDCSAGLWSMCCDGAVVQYNEVAFTGREFGGDGEAFDIDNCSRNTVIQYNYSFYSMYK